MQKGLRPAAIAALLALHPANAFASTSPITAYYPEAGVPAGAPSSALIQVPVTARVGSECGFAAGQEPTANINAGEIDVNAWGQNVPFTAQCTAPWRMAVSSQKGALEAPGGNVQGYSRRAPYSVTLHVNTDAGFVEGTCPVAQIDQAAGATACDFEGTASTTNGLYLQRSYNLSGSYIRAFAPAYSGTDILTAGTYTDTLTVTVSPAI